MNGNELLPFPFGIVMLPEQLIPLHIFEERYKLMIGGCLADNKVFGIAYFDGQKMCSAGCSSRVQEVLKKYPNGRLDEEIQSLIGGNGSLPESLKQRLSGL